MLIAGGVSLGNFMLAPQGGEGPASGVIAGKRDNRFTIKTAEENRDRPKSRNNRSGGARPLSIGQRAVCSCQHLTYHALAKFLVVALAFWATTGAAVAAASEAGGTTQFDLALLVRIGVAVALAFPIGWEREYRGSEAGDRTFMLVSLGAAAFTAVGVENFPSSAEKVMAGVVTGVGFLGGGMILKDGGNIRGLTTAAAIWATAAVGMLAGVGELLIAALVTGMVILILEFEFIPFIGRLDARRWRPKKIETAVNPTEF